MKEIFTKFSNDLFKSLIKEDRYMYIIEGLKNTLIMSFFATIIGITIGIIIVLIKEFAKINKKSKISKILKIICDIYVNFIRGTPRSTSTYDNVLYCF